jgi:hypothetical protein
MEITRDVSERLQRDSRLRRICGFAMTKALPSEATFSRAFAEFAASNLAQKAHEAMIKSQLGDELIGHISTDSTAIAARERAAKSVVKEEKPKPGRGRPKKGEIRPPPEPGKVQAQLEQTQAQRLAQLPKGCDVGTKKNAKGFKESWKGYKLHLDTADCGVTVNFLVTSASMHDSLAAIPLETSTAERVSSLYSLKDAAYCSEHIRAHCASLNHVPLIDHNPRKGEKIEFAPHEAQRYKERSQAERSNARLKDEFGLRQIWVKGHEKATCHMGFAVLALAADQLMRLLL